jgi:hypothetical protein
MATRTSYSKLLEPIKIGGVEIRNRVAMGALQLAGVDGRDPKQLDGSRCGGANELLKRSVENGDVLVEASIRPSGVPKTGSRSAGTNIERCQTCIAAVATLASNGGRYRKPPEGRFGESWSR